jgi:hypothetical protein
MKVINAAVMIQQWVAFPNQLTKTLFKVAPQRLTLCVAGDWRVAMVVTHLMHCEAYFRERFGVIAQEDNPYLPTFGLSRSGWYNHAQHGVAASG